jgi:hypothetical protein
MVDRRRLTDGEDESPKRKAWTPEMELERLKRAHVDHWSDEPVARRKRFAASVGVPTLEDAFHIRDGFRIVCDGLPEGPGGKRCDNVIGFAPLPLQHDGLCERCRRIGYDFEPRIAESPLGIVRDQRTLDSFRNAEIQGDAFETEEADVPPPTEA